MWRHLSVGHKIAWKFHPTDDRQHGECSLSIDFFFQFQMVMTIWYSLNTMTTAYIARSSRTVKRSIIPVKGSWKMLNREDTCAMKTTRCLHLMNSTVPTNVSMLLQRYYEDYAVLVKTTRVLLLNCRRDVDSRAIECSLKNRCGDNYDDSDDFDFPQKWHQHVPISWCHRGNCPVIDVPIISVLVDGVASFRCILKIKSYLFHLGRTSLTIDTSVNSEYLIKCFARWWNVAQLGSFFIAWLRHHMETFSVLLALCAGNSPITGEFPAQRPMTRRFVVFFDLRLN